MLQLHTHFEFIELYKNKKHNTFICIYGTAHKYGLVYVDHLQNNNSEMIMSYWSGNDERGCLTTMVGGGGDAEYILVTTNTICYVYAPLRYLYL